MPNADYSKTPQKIAADVKDSHLRENESEVNLEYNYTLHRKPTDELTLSEAAWVVHTLRAQIEDAHGALDKKDTTRAYHGLLITVFARIELREEQVARLMEKNDDAR